MPEELTKLPEWAEAIHAALPEDGSIKLLVTSRTGVRYLELSRAEIEASAREARARKRRRQQRARQIVGRRRQEFLRATTATVVFIVGLIGALAGVWIDREGTYRELAAERLDIQQRELAFRSYADATRHLIEQDNAQILTELSQLRLDTGQGFGDAFRTRLAGGTDDLSPVLGVLQTRLDLQQQELLLQNLELREFLAALPSVSPLAEMRLVSGFGIRRHPIFRSMQHHAGLDFVTDGDPTIRASQTGVVSQAGRNGGYGLTVEVTSDFGVVTRYAHLRQIDVQPGQRVEAGQGIGVMGSTGLSTGPHLHYEILVNGVQVDPSKVFGLSRNALEKAE